MTMLEKIAATIRQKHYACEVRPLSEQPAIAQAHWLGVARAAVEAMRTPGEAIMDAGYNSMPETYSLPAGALESMMNAAIDAILAEQPGTQRLDEPPKP